MRLQISKTYSTYKGDDEPHRLRLTFAFLASLLITIFGKSLSSTALPAMALTVSVLAGFTFTALFSGHLFSTNSLPEAETENDRDDQRTLLKLCGNLKVRSEFFLISAVIELLTIFVLSIDTLDAIKEVPNLGILEVDLERFLRWVYFLTAKVWTFVGIFVFFEILYTFYRLSETALAIVEVRQRYLDSRVGSHELR